MDFKQQVYDVIASFSGQNNVIVINTAYVDMLGDLESALFLSQVIYWTDKVTREDGFFYKTDDEWSQELRISKYAIRKARKKLEELGILETKVKKANGNPTVHYRLNKECFIEMVISFLRNRKNDHIEIEKTLTEITTEITTNSLSIEKSSFFENNEVDKVSIEYQQKIGQINGDIAIQLEHWRNELGDELVKKAIDIAYEQGKRRWSYIRGILKNFKEDGITSLNDLEKQEKKKLARRGRAVAQKMAAFDAYINSLEE
ncbi:DnaD domain-containing protein [Geobacillus stearothermophilus]|uniref:DnaD domain-containing protein n=1 Tax=Geobacillus stearothermophilus TaxID=1422 RepID=UPI0007790BBC|nr:DnaD domain protein [Geobacillus stearothermophilus]